jgi:ribonuclease VapC
MARSIDLVVDTSALTAILLGEDDAQALLAALSAFSSPGLSAANRTELLIVLQCRLGDVGVQRAKSFLGRMQIRAAVVDERLADAAADAFRRFGKGRHPAGLNFGDCFSYALASQECAPLLFKGEDFRRTDVSVCALP